MNKQSRISEPHRLDIAHRPRRNRKAEWARRLVSEHVLTANDLIWPLFLVEGKKTRTPVAAMPGVDRLSVDEAVREAERAVRLDIPAIAFFPYTEPHLKDEHGSEAFNESNLVCKACRAIKKEFPSSASSPTSRSTPTPATATTASSAITATNCASSMTKRSPRSSASR